MSDKVLESGACSEYRVCGEPRGVERKEAHSYIYTAQWDASSGAIKGVAKVDTLMSPLASRRNIMESMTRKRVLRGCERREISCTTTAAVAVVVFRMQRMS